MGSGGGGWAGAYITGLFCMRTRSTYNCPQFEHTAVQWGVDTKEEKSERIRGTGEEE